MFNCGALNTLAGWGLLGSVSHASAWWPSQGFWMSSAAPLVLVNVGVEGIEASCWGWHCWYPGFLEVCRVDFWVTADASCKFLVNCMPISYWY